MSAGAVVDVPLLLTPAEAAEALRVDVSELRTMRATGSGPDFHDVGRGLIRYVRESVEAFAERAAA
ncbi:helix-turn-helix domain-containing protein [Microbacterium sp. KSW4-11]|uniref:Helix-turn-helix domain-containing protein n=1 Tax=Microbacterium gawkjiense TaxID=3067309 RepID=A0ABU3GE69_9MICO|nr:helix-turn-helix domain-containing protein [Microbacterium sp. KSW4-11]MDT3318093.1 helix-turn-helix domain-containing protein [Microbacterium sp. KSW4-11]